MEKKNKLEKIGDVKILCYDIEVSPARGYFYPPFYKTNILKMDMDQVLMSISWGWVGEYDKDGNQIVHNAKLNDFAARYKKDKYDDYDVTKALHRILNEADIVIGFNNRRFDDKMANTYFVKHKLGPVSPFKTIDLFAVSKGYFKNPSNGLDNVAHKLGYGGKTEIKVGQLWYDCLENRDPESWDFMRDYNNGDILATLDVYYEYRPYIRNHPNMNMIARRQGGCVACGKTDTLQSRGVKPRVNGPVREFWCNTKKGGCGKWNTERVVAPENRIAMEDRHDMVSAT